MMNYEVVWILFSIRDDALRSGSSQYLSWLMMMNYEVDQDNLKHSKADYTELRRWTKPITLCFGHNQTLQSRLNRAEEVDKVDYTVLWTQPNTPKPIILCFGFFSNTPKPITPS
ncbi:hypothetical protein JCGZ_16947 [Jatropha curcas]|uniref:Uncharacterized protein n=1 Tax=Jatropha curcas TaxID=180498 RepID=A0A067KEA0_JATCU|nr:hypothetical protein JCGZ_16947 [Jatropha curcas]